MNDFLFTMIFMFFMLLVITATPFISKKSIAFGVRIPTSQSDHPSLKRFRSQWLKIYLIVGSILILCYGYLDFNNIEIGILTNSNFVLPIIIIVNFYIYQVFRKKVIKLKAKNNWQALKRNTVSIDLSFRKKNLMINKWFFLIYTLIIIITYIIAKNAQVDYHETIITQVVASIIFYFTNYLNQRGRQEISIIDSKRSSEINSKYRFIISLSMYLMGIALLIFMFVDLLYPNVYVFSNYTISNLIYFASFFILITLVMYAGRIRKLTEVETDFIEKNDDFYWKLGMFYFNPKDRNLFVEKRIGVGWTINLANKIAWIIGVIFIGYMFLIFKY